MLDHPVSPLLDAMELGECFSEKGAARCYIIRHPETGREFVLKAVAVPANREQVDALLLTGAYANEDEAAAYYRGVAQALIDEAEGRKQLLDCPYLLPFLGTQMDSRQGEVGYDVYAVLPKRRSLKEYLRDGSVSHLRGINLGIDICTALEALREAGLMEADLKPENIFFSETGRFLLGDYGVLPTADLKYTVLPEQYRGPWTAPELRDLLGGLNETVDTYALGLILYYIYNGSHMPFEDENTSETEAEARRLAGEALPAPMYADYELTEILLKACAPAPADRYRTPTEMRQALELYMRRNAVSDRPIVPPLVADEPVTEEPEETPAPQPEPQPQPEPEPETQPEPQPAPSLKTPRPARIFDAPKDPPPKAMPSLPAPEVKKPRKKKKSGRGLLIFAAVMLVLAALFAVYEFTPFGATLWHYWVKVESLRVTEITPNGLTLELQASAMTDKFLLSCVDSDGKNYYSAFENGVAVFTDLKPDRQYVLEVRLEGSHKLTGETTTTATTPAKAEVTGFTASTGPAEGSVILNVTLSADSTQPRRWSLSYGPEGGESRTTTFIGTEVEIPALETGTPYVFRLVSAGGPLLMGQTEVRYVPTAVIHAEQLAVDSVEDGVARLSWRCLSEPPAEWTVTCTAEDGTELPITVAEPVLDENDYYCAATVTGVKQGATYQISVSASGLYAPLTMELTVNAPIQVESFTAEVTTSGVKLTWTADREPADGWLLTGAGGVAQVAEQVRGNSCVLAVVPETDYVLTLASTDGSPLTGETEVRFRAKESVRFNLYGVTGQGTTIGTYDTPTKENWTFSDLDGGTVTYHHGKPITVVITANGSPDSTERTVTALYVIRDKNDNVVRVDTFHLQWTEMWEGKRWRSQLPAIPETNGKYTLTLYLDSQRVGTIGFTVVD